MTPAFYKVDSSYGRQNKYLVKGVMHKWEEKEKQEQKEGQNPSYAILHYVVLGTLIYQEKKYFKD